MKQFADKADFQIRFQPFQLYPELPRLDPNGVDKRDFFQELTKQRNPEVSEKAADRGFQHLQGEWAKDGLQLSKREGTMGNSFDAQRLISFARKQGREDQLIEAVYTANHENNLCLSSRTVLLACAEKAGLQGAEEMLNSNQEFEEVLGKIESYRAMGINSVPVLLFNEKFPIHGAPDRRLLGSALQDLVESRSDLEVKWPPEAPPLPPIPDLVQEACHLVDKAEDHGLSKHKLDWSDDDPRFRLIEERLLKNCSIKKLYGSAFGELQEALRGNANPKWGSGVSLRDLAIGRPAEASSQKNEERAASFAVDGKPDTRWTSAYQDEQWLSVDLGDVVEISRVDVCWEVAHAETYLVQGSDDGQNWMTLSSETGHAGWVTSKMPSGQKARWVRVFGQKRATQFGFSIWEVRVFGTMEDQGPGAAAAA